MHPASRSPAGGFTHLSLPESHKQQDKCATDSGAIDSGFHSSDQTFSSDNFASSSEVQEPQVEACFQPSSKQTAHQHRPCPDQEDSQTFDSGVDLDSGRQQCRTNEQMRVDNMGDLCKGLLQLRMGQKDTSMQLVKWEKYFYQNDDGDTYLHLAILHNAADVFYKLLHVAAQPWLDIQNDLGQTALHLSVLVGQPQFVRHLVIAGANRGIRDMDGNTPLHLACIESRTACAMELLTPLSALELQHSSPAAQAVIKIPQDLEQWNYDGKRCVHLAAKSSNIEILHYLVRAGADINSREGKAGFTALHMAIEADNQPLVSFLLANCPKLRIEQETYAGLTPYQLAAIQRNQSLQSTLSSHGAEPYTPPVSDYEDDEDSQPERDEEDTDDEKE